MSQKKEDLKNMYDEYLKRKYGEEPVKTEEEVKMEWYWR